MSAKRLNRAAVLGLGNIGPYAALPVMEGKAALFKRFADIDAWPICLDSQDTDEIVRTVQLEIGPHYIVPSVFHPDVTLSVAVAVAVADVATQNPDR